jgi:transcriptional regulator with XRE-family HTH domain
MRRQQGLSRRQLGIDAGQKGAETWVGYVENGKIANVRPANKVKLFTALHVPPQLFEYLDGINGNIPPSIYTLLRDSFYFTEDNPPESEPPFSREDILMANALRDADSFGAGLYKMRTSMGLYPREVTFQRKHTRRIEEGDEIPNDYLIARTTSWFGFHVLDETTQVLLDLAARDRRKRVTA